VLDDRRTKHGDGIDPPTAGAPPQAT
jgi:hypothetical protein